MVSCSRNSCDVVNRVLQTSDDTLFVLVSHTKILLMKRKQENNSATVKQWSRENTVKLMMSCVLRSGQVIAI